MVRNSIFLFSVYFIFQISLSQDLTWVPTNGPYGNDVRAIAVNSKGHVFVGCGSAGIFFSSNSGEDWNAIPNTIIGGYSIISLIVDKCDNIYAGYGSQGIFKTTNNGISWNKLSNFSIKQLYTLYIDPKGILFAGTSQNGVYRSTDNGETWIESNTGLPELNVRSFTSDSAGNIYAAISSHGIFRSTNSGANWLSVKLLDQSQNIQALVKNKKGYLYAAITNGGILRSKDHGQTWNQLTNSTAQFNSIVTFGLGANGEVFAGTSGSDALLFKSQTDGNIWNVWNYGIPDCYQYNAINSNSEYTFAAVQGNGLYRLRSGDFQWTQIGVPNTTVFSLLVDQENNVIAGLGGDEIFLSRSNNGGKNWIDMNMDFSGNQAINSIGIQTSNKLLVGTLSGDIFRTSDFGKTWDGWEAAVPNTSITSFLMTNEGKLLVGTDGKGVYYLKADESGWMEISKGLSNQIVTSLTQHTNGNIFASTFGGGLFVSTNEGTSWDTTGQKTGQLRKVAVTKDGLLYIVENNVGILSSTDFGISWSRILTAPVRGLFISKHGYVFTSLGYTDTTSSIYFSKNNGASWVKSNTQTITSVISSFAEDSLGYIYAGTFGSGVYRSSISTRTSVADDRVLSPSSMTVLQNYPNPF